MATTGAVTLSPGETAKPIAIPIIGDRVARGNTTFGLRVTSVVGALKGKGNGKVSILDPNVPMTVLDLNSQPDDWIGLGRSWLLTSSDNAFTSIVWSLTSVLSAIAIFGSSMFSVTPDHQACQRQSLV